MEINRSYTTKTGGREASQDPQLPRGWREARLEKSRGEEKMNSINTRPMLSGRQEQVCQIVETDARVYNSCTVE